MPIVRIAALPGAGDPAPGPILRRLCRSLAELDGTDANRWWATWQVIEPGWYVEGDRPGPPVQPTATHPPIVEILAFTGREAARIERLLATVVAILAAELDVEPGNVFAYWTELGSGRVSTGGLVRRLDEGG